MARNLQGADVLLDPSVTDISPVDPEIQVEGLKGDFEPVLINSPGIVDHPVLERMESDSPVHCPGVEVEKGVLFCYQLGKRALAG